MSPAVDTSAKSGIIISETGERHIPSSIRPDGTKRKEIKVRPGYKPPEDVEVYKNRTAEAWKTRGAGGVLGAAAVGDDLKGTGYERASNKNAKRREARKKAKEADDRKESNSPDAKVDGPDEKAGGGDGPLAKANWRAPSHGEEAELDPEAEKEKQARTLKKKLRQARELREKSEKGENLLPEQFEKVIRINELIRQLDNLGFDPEGERKAQA